MDISVVIPLYNKKNTIKRTLNSVFIQKYQPVEIIVVDDGSTDGSEEIVSSLEIKNLKLIKQQNNGVSAARNRGIKEALCTWIAFLDGDDEWLPNFLLTIKSMYDADHDHDVYATSYYSGDYLGNKKKIGLNAIRFRESQGVMTNYFEVASCSAPPICSSTVCIRKQALIDIGGFPLNVKSGEDLITWARLVAKNPPLYSTVPLAVFWQEKSHTYDDKPNRIPEKDDPIGKALARLKKESDSIPLGIDFYISHWHKMRASIYLRFNMRVLAAMECIKGLFYNPLNYKLYFYLLLLIIPYQVVRVIFKKFSS
jgi:glycosyltransferase involved in cell wall biosynthesis